MCNQWLKRTLPWLATLALVLVAPMLARAQAGQDRLVLTDAGKSAYVIALADQAAPATRYAAEELQKFLQEISGAELAIVTDSPAEREREIVVGDSPRLRDLMKADAKLTEEMKGLGEEGYVIKTVGQRLVIAGAGGKEAGAGRGTLYGVYGLLSDHLGCRWFTPAVSRIPKLEKIVVGPLAERKVPALEYREVMAFDCWEPNWMARNRLNTTKLLDEKHGGAIKYVPDYYVHTFDKLVPTKEYFATHPEYFCEVGGKRLSDKNQLCCTNEEVVGIVTEKVRKLLKDNPEARVVSVSQNDGNQNYCQCAKCAAIDAQEGTHAGQVLFLVNRVAEAVAKEFPDRAVETLAYEWSRTPPKTMKPRANVIIRLSTIQCSFSESLEGARGGKNRAFRQDLEGWAAVSQRLWIWDYITYFSYYPLPFPNWRVLDGNLRFFVKNHVTGVVEQANWQSPAVGLAGLTNYLAATYLWNPQYDREKAIGEYLDGVYGPAAGPIKKYVDLLANEVETQRIPLPIYGSRTPPYLTTEILQAADKLWDEAEAAVAGAGMEDVAKRVRVARLGHDYAYIEHWHFKPENMVKYEGTGKKAKVVSIDPGYEAHVRRFLQVAPEAGLQNIREGKPDYAELETWLKGLLPAGK